jgi:hypothetical protein
MSFTNVRSARIARLTDDDVVPLLVFIVLGAFAWITPAQNDTWWHLRSGQAMWETGSLLRTEGFSHTAFGADLHNYWWLTQLAFYALFMSGGPVLLTVMAGACAFTAVLGSWRLMRGSWEVRLVVLLFMSVATLPEWSVRPQVISLALLVLTAHLVVRDRTVWLPLICAIWANAHPQVVFGVLMAGAAALEALVWSRTRFKRDALIAACCAAAVMISPGGWHYWPEAFRTVSVSRLVELQEYRAPLDAGSIPFWIAVAVMAFAAVRKRAALSGWRRGHRVLLIAAALLAVASLGAARNIAFFAVIAAPVVSWLLASSEPEKARALRPAGTFAYVFAVVALVAATIVIRTRWHDGGVQLGWRPLSASVLEAVDRCPDPMFNHLDDGGYLMWALPSRRVFVDSRMNAYPLELLQRSREADLRGDYATLFSDYGIRCAVVLTDSALRQRLARDPSMTATYADDQRMIFTRAAGE